MKQTTQSTEKTKDPTVGSLELLPPESKDPTVGSLVLAPATVEQRLEKFTDYHKTVILSAGNILLARFLAGVELIAIKAALSEERGFKAFCKERIIEQKTASHGAIHNYMNYAEGMIHKFPAIGNLVEQRLLPTGKLPDDAKAELQEAIYEAADGKDITSLYRDLGVVRKKKDAKHHPRKEVNPLATEEEKDKAANEDWLAIRADVELNLPALERVTAENREAILASLLKATALLRTIGKGKKKKSGPDASAKSDKAVGGFGKSPAALAKEAELKQAWDEYEKKKSPKPSARATPEARAKLAAAARTRWARTKDTKGAK